MLRTVAGSMAGGVSAAPTRNGVAGGGAGLMAGLELDSGVGKAADRAVLPTAEPGRPDEAANGLIPELSPWSGDTAGGAFPPGRLAKYQTPTARAQRSRKRRSRLAMLPSPQMNPRFVLEKRPRFGKTVVRLLLSTPNQVANVAKY